jgi:hypothetical protein
MKAIRYLLLSALLVVSSVAFAATITATTPVLGKGTFSQTYQFTTSSSYPSRGAVTINLSGSSASFSALSFEVLKSSGSVVVPFINASKQNTTLAASWTDPGGRFTPYTLTANTNYLVVVDGTALNAGVKYALSASGLMRGSTFAQVPAIPEPETYSMLFAGIGLIGVIRRRRKNR